MYASIYRPIYMYMYVYVCVCVCMYIYACIQLNAALMCVRDFLLKHLNVANPKVLNGSVYLYLHIKRIFSICFSI